MYKLAVDRRFSAYAMEALICGKPITSEWPRCSAGVRAQQGVGCSQACSWGKLSVEHIHVHTAGRC